MQQRGHKRSRSDAEESLASASQLGSAQKNAPSKKKKRKEETVAEGNGGGQQDAGEEGSAVSSPAKKSKVRAFVGGRGLAFHVHVLCLVHSFHAALVLFCIEQKKKKAEAPAPAPAAAAASSQPASQVPKHNSRERGHAASPKLSNE